MSLPFILLMLLGAVGLFAGWRLFWFLTDDAFIEYRYVSNSLIGHGYVWNASPFMPVEGYTSFLWLVLLDVTWRVTGSDPPRSANVLALVFSYGQLVLSALMMRHVAYRWASRAGRWILLTLFLVGVLGNRTFLTWTSSGLEAALFNFLLTLWLFVMAMPAAARHRMLLASIAATLLALTRPDGLLFVAGTFVATVLVTLREHTLARGWKRVLRTSAPFLAVVVHEVWRLSYYHAWLPNTYYAKVVEPWPASGIRYLASFILEYAVWLPVLAIVGLACVRRLWRTPLRTWKSAVASRVPLTVACVTMALDLAYYTFIVGGDHFEYRVYSYAIPILFVAFAYALLALGARARTATLLTASLVILSMPVPWTHWAITKNLTTRDETLRMWQPIAGKWPKPVRWYASMFDETQRWLIKRSACTRHQEHKVFWKFQIDHYPTRAVGREISGVGVPVLATAAVGVPAWVFPHVNILDIIGLNDYVVARTPYPKLYTRRMAHGRRAPTGYVQSFRPNVNPDGVVITRPTPLSATQVKCLERYWRSQLPEIKSGKRRFDYRSTCAG